MRRTLTALLLLLALTAACASPLPSTTTTSTPDAPSTPPSSAPTTLSAPGAPPKPDAATAQAYLADLRAIDPAIVEEDDTDKAVRRGRSQCASVKNSPGDQAKLVDLTNKRFTGPDHPNGFGLEKAERILVAVRKHICPTY